MSIENFDIIRRGMRTPPERFEEIYHPNFVNHPPLPVPGVEGMKELSRRYASAFENFSATIIKQLPAGDKNDMVVTVYKAEGKLREPLDTSLGPVPASGRTVEFFATTIVRISDGRIVERWGFV